MLLKWSVCSFVAGYIYYSIYIERETEILFIATDKQVVVAVVSRIQRIALATKETTVSQQVSHRPIKCQSRSWSQRGTGVNGSHHGDNRLLRPTGTQIATKPMPGPASETYRRQDDVFGYEPQFLM